ncbi:MAG: hypothetical protein OXF85_02920 [Candidatus Saccharibacteria bacterium]|nr:hypothetical protein [Candidatus Saccharibacteria bacterium]MCY4088981.1 hypothetical protein [Candidatus Saccharibacteria bacterium]
MSYNVDDQCKKEIKALDKKHKHLASDLKTFIQTHQVANDPNQPDDYRRNFFSSKNATILHGSLRDKARIIKARLYSTDLRDKSLRVIYLANDRDLTLIEIYSKGKKPTEDKRRWQTYK